MTAKDIKSLLEAGERIILECKKADNSIPKSVWETYSSFANTVGGTILLGVTEHLEELDIDKRFEITGVRNVLKMRKEFFDTINSNKVSRNILTDNDVEPVEFEGQTLLCINVPQADYRQRPIFINGNIMNGSFKRNFEGDYHCTEDDVKAMIRDANDSGNDGVLMENYGMDDIDTNALNAYRNRFRTANQDHVWNDYGDKEFLQNMGGYTIDRITRREGLTLAGLLMFGKGLPIRERFDNIRMDYLDMTNLEHDSRWSDRLTYDGRWENNLYNFFMKVQSKLVADLKRPFRLEGMERIDDTPIHKAVREALTNLIIHADYMTTGVLRVEKHDSCFKFSNPGSLKLPVTEIYAGSHSQARNPNMQAMLRMIGFGDNIGSGFPTILSAWKKENWQKPILSESTEPRQVDLVMPMVSLISEDCVFALQQMFGQTYPALDNEEKIILATAWTEGDITNYRTQILLEKNPIEAGRLLYTLVAKGILISTSKGRWTKYTVNTEFDETDKASRSKTTKHQVEASSKQDRLQVEASSKKDQILKFCSEPKSLKEIMDHVGLTDRVKFKKNYINPLLGTCIQMTQPNSPNSPTQKYVTIKND